jgi:hypothetical protein
MNKKRSVPLAYHSIFNKLKNYIEINDLHLKYFTKTVKSSGDKIQLPHSYTSKDNWAVDTYTLDDGILVKKAIQQHPHMTHPKLIIANKVGFNGAFIDEGN